MLTFVHQRVAHIAPRDSRPRPRPIHRGALECQSPLRIARLVARLEALHTVDMSSIEERDNVLRIIVQFESRRVGEVTRAAWGRGVGHVDDDRVSSGSRLITVGGDVAAEEGGASGQSLSDERVGRFGDSGERGVVCRVVASALGGGEKGGTVGPCEKCEILLAFEKSPPKRSQTCRRSQCRPRRRWRG